MIKAKVIGTLQLIFFLIAMLMGNNGAHAAPAKDSVSGDLDIQVPDNGAA